MKSYKTKNCIMNISTPVLYAKRLSKKKQQNHIKYDHQEWYCVICDKYFTQLSNKKDHEITYIKCRKCYKNFKSLTKIRKHKKRSLSKYYKKQTLHRPAPQLCPTFFLRIKKSFFFIPFLIQKM